MRFLLLHTFKFSCLIADIVNHPNILRLAFLLLFLVFVLPAVSLAAPPGSTASVPSGFTETSYGSGLSLPTAMDIAPDGRIFVTEQGGNLRIIKNGSTLSTPFLTVNTEANGERGLLGVALDPSFASNNFVYVYY